MNEDERVNDEPEAKTPLDADRLQALTEQVVAGHPREAELRSALDAGAKLLLSLPDDPHDPDGRVEVYLPGPDGTMYDPIGDFPVSEALPPQN
jgi:hypothetical protein